MPDKIDHIARRDKELPYISDERVLRQQIRTKTILKKYNKIRPYDTKRAAKLLDRIGVKHGDTVYLEPPFRCDYGFHIEIGEDFYANTNCVMVDVAPIRIGAHCQFGPNVVVCTAGHPIHPDTRNSKYEYGIHINIGESVWLCANVFVGPGVTIGDNVVIGAGSVVVRDIPPNCVAVGNPCRVIRTITEADREFYFRDRRIEPEILATIMP